LEAAPDRPGKVDHGRLADFFNSNRQQRSLVNMLKLEIALARLAEPNRAAPSAAPARSRNRFRFPLRTTKAPAPIEYQLPDC
jgi:hypothetical protein